MASTKTRTITIDTDETPVIPAAIPDEPTLVDVTPGIAAGWLLRNTRNRTLRSAAVDAMARDMHNGLWIYDGSPIRFAATGELLDGQHRLAAVVDSKSVIRFLVIPNLPVEARDVMDSGTRRTAADVLTLRGEVNTAMLAAAARVGLAVDAGQIVANGTRITNPEVIAWVDRHPDIRDHVRWMQGHVKNLDLRPAIATWARWRFAQVDAAAAVKFFDDLANSTPDGPGDPVGALLRRLGQARRTSERLTSATQVSMVVRTWNARRKGERLERIQAASRAGRIEIPDVA